MIRRLGDEVHALLQADAVSAMDLDLRALTEADGLAMCAGRGAGPRSSTMAIEPQEMP